MFTFDIMHHQDENPAGFATEYVLPVDFRISAAYEAFFGAWDIEIEPMDPDYREGTVSWWTDGFDHTQPLDKFLAMAAICGWPEDIQDTLWEIAHSEEAATEVYLEAERKAREYNE